MPPLPHDGGVVRQNRRMPSATISVDAELKERLADLASQTGQGVDEFVEALLQRFAESDVRFESGVQSSVDVLALQRSRSKTLIVSPASNSVGILRAYPTCRSALATDGPAGRRMSNIDKTDTALP